MRIPDEPTPEERGELGPPRHVPPVAVGVATPPPPRPPRLLGRLRPIRVLKPVLYGLTNVALGVAVLIWLPSLRGLGWTLIAIGILLVGILFWARFFAAPFSAWRQRRRIRSHFSKQQSAQRPTA